MEKQVIFRDRQHLEHTDLNNVEIWADESLSHVVADALTTEKQFVGLTVTARSATEIEVSPGRLYDGTTGRIYALEAAQVQSIFAMLPLQDQKWLAISGLGAEEETNLEPRDFLIDLETRQVEPQVVAMQRRRYVLVHVAQGLESPTPERPQPPTGYTLLAHVRLGPAGIQEIVLADTFRLPNLYAVDRRVRAAEGWIVSAEPRLSTIASDIAGLASDLSNRATIEQAMQLALDMARVKERLEIPDDYVFYGADHYLTDDETNDQAAGYAARIDEGVRMPVAAAASAPLALFNPLDPAVKSHDDGFVLPAYQETPRLRLEKRVGELTINQYQYTTLDVVRKTMPRERIRYGATRRVCTNSSFWRSGQYDPATGIFRRGEETWEVAPEDRGRVHPHTFLRLTQFWVDRWSEPYWDVVKVVTTVQGSQLAQTFLSAQTGWMTSAEIYLTGVANDGALNVLLTETTVGQPDLTRTIAQATVAASALVGGWNRIAWPRPTYLEAGKRYALVLVTGGAHRVGTADGKDYTQGLLLYTQDGAYFTAADDRDLMLRFNFARFAAPRTTVQLAPLQLGGGIHDVDLLYEGWTPPGCELHFEYQVGGVWHTMNGRDASALGDGTALVPLRAVFVGTSDLMPGLLTTDSVSTVRRFGASFVHFSTPRTLATGSQDIRVRCLLESFDAALHSFDCALVVGGSPVAATSTIVEIVDGAAGARWVESRFALGAATTEYVIKLTGGTTDVLAPFHVSERYDLAL